jgi:hypothetical protein
LRRSASQFKGIYVDEFSNGQVKIGEGDFTFFVKSGFLIENGCLDLRQRAVRPRLLRHPDRVDQEFDGRRRISPQRIEAFLKTVRFEDGLQTGRLYDYDGTELDGLDNHLQKFSYSKINSYICITIIKGL